MKRDGETIGDSPGLEHDGSGPLDLAFLKLVEASPGTVVNDRYRLERLIGQGGFGIVFEARDLTLESRLAVKFLDPRLTRSERKFRRVQREINLSRRISDERIVKVFSLESWQGIVFLVMELAQGRSLKSFLQERGRCSWAECRDVFLQILEAVDALHRCGIVHRDLKPSNILVGHEGRIKILDFGLAKEVEDAEKTSSIGEIVGSPYYMSPEQIRGWKVDCRSDVYQLGLVMYRALSGRHPFEHTSTMEVIFKQLNQRPEPIAAGNNDLPRFLRFGLEKALEKSPARRFRDAGAMARFFKKERISFPLRLIAAFGRGPVKYALASAALAALLALGYAATFGSREVHGLRYRGSVLEAVNRVGVRLWKNDFSPAAVYHAHQTNSRIPLPQGTGIPSEYMALDIGNAPIAIALLIPGTAPVFPAAGSIAGDSLLCQRAFVDARGKVIRREPLVADFEYDAYDYVKVIKPHEVLDLGKRADGEAEVLFTVQQYQSMYPFSLVFCRGVRKFVFTHPGTFATTTLERTGAKVAFMLFGINNLFAHMSFVAEIAFDTTRGANGLLKGIPNLSPDARNNVPHEEKLFILPFRARLLENRWREKGWARFSEDTQGDILELDRSGRLTVRARNGRFTYYDSPDTLRRVYTLVNTAFQERMMKRNPGNALKRIKEADAFPLSNPFLRSALLYMKGDLEVELGRHGEGEASLRRALDLFPGNNDASERLCEMEMLRGDVPAALRRLADSRSDSSQFWGFSSFGVQLFRGYLFMHAGMFSQAEADFARIRLRLVDLGMLCRAAIDVFRGQHEAALDALRELERRPLGSIDVRELRLLLGRALLLSGRDEARARFLFEDIFRNSLEYGHLAELSSCYLLARSGRVAEAAATARQAFERLQSKARGDFMTRLWLFYDAYIFGRTMELAGDTAGASRGYRACIAANPWTELAARARQRLDR